MNKAEAIVVMCSNPGTKLYKASWSTFESMRNWVYYHEARNGEPEGFKDSNGDYVLINHGEFDGNDWMVVNSSKKKKKKYRWYYLDSHHVVRVSTGKYATRDLAKKNIIGRVIKKCKKISQRVPIK